jgi:hypothetical protein
MSAASDKKEKDEQESGAKISKKAPTRAGEYDGEVVDGWRYDRASDEWVSHRGVDFSDEASANAMPFGHEHVGDGSKEKPHEVRAVQRW